MIGRIAKKLKGEAGTCGGCFTTVFSDEDYVVYRGGIFCVDCAIYSLKDRKKKGGRSVKTGRPRSEDELTPQTPMGSPKGRDAKR